VSGQAPKTRGAQKTRQSKARVIVYGKLPGGQAKRGEVKKEEKKKRKKRKKKRGNDSRKHRCRPEGSDSKVKPMPTFLKLEKKGGANGK
jgi:hypothetical protein